MAAESQGVTLAVDGVLTEAGRNEPFSNRSPVLSQMNGFVDAVLTNIQNFWDGPAKGKGSSKAKVLKTNGGGKATTADADVATLDFVQEATKACAAAVGSVTEKHIKRLDQRIDDLQTDADNKLQVMAKQMEEQQQRIGLLEKSQASSCQTGAAELQALMAQVDSKSREIEKVLNDTETAQKKIADMDKQIHDLKSSSQKRAEDNDRHWMVMGCLGYDTPPATLVQRAKQVSDAVGIQASQYSHLASKSKAPGSCVQFRLANQTDYFDIKSKISSCEITFLESGRKPWADWARTEQDWKPVNIHNKAFAMLSNFVASGRATQRQIVIKESKRDKHIKINDNIIAYVSMGLLRWTAFARDYFDEADLNECKQYAEQ